MHLFITGTDTGVGKTLISSWLCLHTGYAYFKPIQTGSREGRDSEIVQQLANTEIHQETFLYQEPLSPHASAKREGKTIDTRKVQLPRCDNLVIEGAGGVLVPLNHTTLMVDLIKQTAAAAIVVARSTLGTINHTLLTIESLRARAIRLLGVIINGPPHPENAAAIASYGNIPILATMPVLPSISTAALQRVPLPPLLQRCLYQD